MARSSNNQRCSNCEEIEIERPISNPAELSGTILLLNSLISRGKIKEHSNNSVNAFIEQPSFSSIDPHGKYPDFMDYHFCCNHCGNIFQLEVETYHGRGGAIKIVGNLQN